MIIYSSAKINIGLNILNKRKDNYHNIKTLFYPIKICDFIEVKILKGHNKITFDSNNKSLLSSNTVIDAYNIMSEDYQLPSLSVYLFKRIPIGAGLGGGSSNGFFFLKYLFQILDIANDVLLLEKANKLGADCSFFYYNSPVIAEGKGDVFSKINFSLQGFRIFCIYPNILINTQEAYSLFENSKINNMRQSYDFNKINSLKVERYEEYIYNDFEFLLFDKYPVLKEIKSQLYDNGALYVSLTGSGSTIYGVFKDDQKIDLNYFKKYFSWSENL